MSSINGHTGQRKRDKEEASSNSSQRFIAKNRAPRVQIEYEVELFGVEKKVQVPFVMGVMSDLSGASEAPLPKVENRKFMEFDAENFDDRVKAMKPRVAIQVKNTLTGDGELPVSVTFESMEDFSPASIAKKVEPLHELLKARQQLSDLLTYMDGKGAAEELLASQLNNPAEFKKLVETLGGKKTP